MNPDRPRFARTLSAAFGIAALAASLSLPAQAPPPPPPDGGAEALAEGGTRDAARFFLLQRMRDELQLTDSQSLKVLDLMRAMDAERRTHRVAVEGIAQKIRTLQAAADSTEAQFREQVILLQREQGRFDAKLREMEQKVLDALTPKQQAGFLLMKRRLLDRPSQGSGPGQPNPKGRREGRGRNRP